jgi:hypothetical protein
LSNRHRSKEKDEIMIKIKVKKARGVQIDRSLKGMNGIFTHILIYRLRGLSAFFPFTIFISDQFIQLTAKEVLSSKLKRISNSFLF